MNRVVIDGKLACDARAATRPDGTALVIVLIEQPGADQVLVERSLGQGAAARYAAVNAAASMRRGLSITAHGTHLSSGRYQRTKVIRLHGVDHIGRAAALVHLHEPMAERAAA